MVERGPQVVELAGGVGGARLASGLMAHLGPDLTVVVNTGDDLERHGLAVWPDHDTLLYTLAGIDNRAWGWGVEGETFAAAGMLARYGEETWFRLGDRDLATHVVRTARLREGLRPTTVALSLQAALEVPARILPMADEPVRTRVRTDAGWLDFQAWFVGRHQEPLVHEVRFDGIGAARPTPEVLDALERADAVVMAPSNPFVSLDPILAVPGMREAVEAARGRGVPVAAMSGIVGGRAIKGPADRMFAALAGEAPSALAVARRLAGFVDLFVLDEVDADLAPAIEQLGMAALVTDTMLVDDDARRRIGGVVLHALGVARRDVSGGDPARGYAARGGA